MTEKTETKQKDEKVKELPKCGVIMPISAIDGRSEDHWKEVKAIIFDAITNAGFIPSLVSDADDIGVIQGRIIQNIYNNEMIVCDVSAKNPNVMFELGFRLAFDKPVVILKDDDTNYSFDTSVIEHLNYPQSLRYPDIVKLKESLTAKIKATYEASQKPNNTTFLKHFGEYKVSGLDEKVVSENEYILKGIEGIQKSIWQFLNKIRADEETRLHQNSLDYERIGRTRDSKVFRIYDGKDDQ